jgi:hypothetical protein
MISTATLIDLRIYSDLNDKFHFCVKSIFTFLPASIGPVKTGPCFSAAMLAKI